MEAKDLLDKIEQEKQEKDFKNVKIIANLPYYITTPIIKKLVDDLYPGMDDFNETINNIYILIFSF